MVYNLILTGEAMEWGGRSISLVNLHGPAGEGTPGSRRRHTSGDTASASASTTTSLATAAAAPQTPEGEVDIFEHGSPISGVGEDPSILDEDSNDAKRDDLIPVAQNRCKLTMARTAATVTQSIINVKLLDSPVLRISWSVFPYVIRLAQPYSVRLPQLVHCATMPT